MKAYTKNPVGAGYGLGDWLLQRLTAIVMAFYTVALVAALFICKPATHADWKAMFAGGFMRIATLLFLAALLYHAWVGIRDIIMDYIKPAALRLTVQTLVALALLGYLAWSVAILWGR